MLDSLTDDDWRGISIPVVVYLTVVHARVGRCREWRRAVPGWRLRALLHVDSHALPVARRRRRHLRRGERRRRQRRIRCRWRRSDGDGLALRTLLRRSSDFLCALAQQQFDDADTVIIVLGTPIECDRWWDLGRYFGFGQFIHCETPLRQEHINEKASFRNTGRSCQLLPHVRHINRFYRR